MCLLEVEVGLKHSWVCGKIVLDKFECIPSKLFILLKQFASVNHSKSKKTTYNISFFLYRGYFTFPS